MIDLSDYLLDDCGTWWLYRLPDGREVRIDIDGPMRFSVDVERGECLAGQTTEQVEATLRRLIGNA